MLAWPTSEPERPGRQPRAGSAARVTDAARPQLAHRSAAGVWNARPAKGVRAKQLTGASIGRPADAAAAPALTPGLLHVWYAEHQCVTGMENQLRCCDIQQYAVRLPVRVAAAVSRPEGTVRVGRRKRGTPFSHHRRAHRVPAARSGRLWRGSHCGSCRRRGR